MARHSLSHIARGSRGAMFFQWRASRGGSEQYHAALVPHAGPDSRVFREAVDFGGLLGRLAEVDGAKVDAPVAILWDAEAWWGLLGPGLPSADVRYVDQLYAAHRALWRAGVTADFVAPEADLSGYRLVLVPSLYLVSDEGAESVRRYVRAGGHLMVWYFSGIVDIDAQVRLGGYPGAFREVLGVRVEEFHPLPPERALPLTSGATGRTWSEHVHLVGATAVDRYAPAAGDCRAPAAGVGASAAAVDGSCAPAAVDSSCAPAAGVGASAAGRSGAGALAGLPAVTRNDYGTGVAWYLSTGLDDADLAALMSSVLSTAGVTPPISLTRPPGSPESSEVASAMTSPGTFPGLEIVHRRAGHQRWLFLINHSDQPYELLVRGTDLAGATDVITGVALDEAAGGEAGAEGGAGGPRRRS